jgi:transcriptional regulator with XRE-family HTH domain
VSRLQNYLRTHRRRFGLSQKEVAKLLGVASGTKVSRYENFIRTPSVVTVFACEIVFNQPASELFAGRYEEIRAAVRERASQLLTKLNDRPDKQSKKFFRKLELLRAIVEANTNAAQRI